MGELREKKRLGAGGSVFLIEGTKKERIVRGSCTVHGYPTGMGRFIVLYIFIPGAS